MKLRVLAALTVCLLFGPAMAQDAKDELKKFAGSWKMTKFESGDKKAPPEEFFAKIRFVFEGEKLLVKVEGQTKDETTFKIDPSKKPKQIDVTSSMGPNKGKVAEGIYELDGDKLKICTPQPGEPRPTEFKAPMGSKTGILYLERDKS